MGKDLLNGIRSNDVSPTSLQPGLLASSHMNQRVNFNKTTTFGMYTNSEVQSQREHTGSIKKIILRKPGANSNSGVPATSGDKLLAANKSLKEKLNNLK